MSWLSYIGEATRALAQCNSSSSNMERWKNSLALLVIAVIICANWGLAMERERSKTETEGLCAQLVRPLGYPCFEYTWTSGAWRLSSRGEEEFLPAISSEIFPPSSWSRIVHWAGSCPNEVQLEKYFITLLKVKSMAYLTHQGTIESAIKSISKEEVGKPVMNHKRRLIMQLFLQKEREGNKRTGGARGPDIVREIPGSSWSHVGVPLYVRSPPCILYSCAILYVIFLCLLLVLVAD
eukprot:Gb_14891 [translate_table: standard]